LLSYGIECPYEAAWYCGKNTDKIACRAFIEPSILAIKLRGSAALKVPEYLRQKRLAR
jgi:hypothetical protein